MKLIIENPLNQNRMLDGAGAYALGLADALFDGADFLERSLDWAGRVVAGTATVTRDPIDRGEAWDAALAEAREFVDAKVGGASPGPYRALELMAAAKTADRTSAYAAEDEASGRHDHGPASCGPACTRSSWCGSGPASPPAPPTGRWPGR